MRARTFREQVLEPAAAVLGQVGLKEIRYGKDGAVESALAELGDVKVIMLGRDPRDMYISLAHRRQGEIVRGLQGTFGPDAVIADVEREMRAQARLMDARDCLRVRYEDLCRDPAVIARVRQYVGSPVRGDGTVGLFKENNRRVHGTAMTVLRVERHRQEPDARLVAEATEVARRLGDYCERWGYAALSRGRPEGEVELGEPGSERAGVVSEQRGELRVAGRLEAGLRRVRRGGERGRPVSGVEPEETVRPVELAARVASARLVLQDQELLAREMRQHAAELQVVEAAQDVIGRRPSAAAPASRPHAPQVRAMPER